MTEQQKLAYVAEMERRWRERTPSTDILSALPGYRVGRSEMRAWFLETYQQEMDFDDETDVQPLVAKMFARLRRKFPGERWD